MVRLSRVRAATGAVALASMFAIVLSMGVRVTDAGEDAHVDRPATNVSARRAVSLTDGFMLDLAGGAVVVSGERLRAADYLTLVPSTIRVADHPIELAAFEIIDVEFLSRIAPPVMQSGTMHVCGFEEAGAWETADGGCKDLVTGLVWGTSQVNWRYPTAEQDAADSNEGGFDDWRLPTRGELETVVDHEALLYFAPGTSGGYRWSTTQKTGQQNWGIRLSDGTARAFRSGGAPFGLDYLGYIKVRDSNAPPPPPGDCNNDGNCDSGEDCETCPSDCDSKPNGRQSGRYCCGNGILEGPEGDGRCDGNP